MTVGEKIQMYRKNLGLSQEDLAEKLLVSRQSISLWEKGQTFPTIDNLIRLKEIFGVSVDEILDVAKDKEPKKEVYRESYTFAFSEKEVDEIQRKQKASVYYYYILQLVYWVAVLVVLILTSQSADVFFVAVLGILICAILSIKSIVSYLQVFKFNKKRMLLSTYECNIFVNFMEITVRRNGEKAKYFKINFSEIQQIKQTDKYLYVQFDGLVFVLRKADLLSNSLALSLASAKNTKNNHKYMSSKWKIPSLILFVFSFLSLFGAELTSVLVSGSEFIVQNMWVFYLWTPIPIASVVLGLVMKSKGYKYKKNVVVGLIFTILLCLYGAFAFIF